MILGVHALSAQSSQQPQVTNLEIHAGVQFVGIYTAGAKADVNTNQVLEPVDDRFDFHVRRGRLTVSGTALDTLDFRAVLAYDNIGKDRFTGTRSTPNDSNSVTIWEAFSTWRANRRWANVTLGFFRPQIGRESITTWSQINSSMDKLPTQVYLRLHMVGRSSGREAGVNLGGLYNRSRWGLNYNVGCFDTSHEKVTGAPSGGSRWAPLVVGRVAFSLGDPEMKSYGIDYRVNYFDKRNGVTGAVNYSRQGENNVFAANELVGFDLLGNYRHWNLTAELDLMRRKTLSQLDYTDRVWHVRSGYNIPARGTFLEPVMAYMNFAGDQNSPYRNGRDRLFDLGLNWYVKETRLKLNVHCTRQRGEGISLVSDGKTFQKGNMIGFGVQLML